MTQLSLTWFGDSCCQPFSCQPSAVIVTGNLLPMLRGSRNDIWKNSAAMCLSLENWQTSLSAVTRSPFLPKAKTRQKLSIVLSIDYAEKTLDSFWTDTQLWGAFKCRFPSVLNVRCLYFGLRKNIERSRPDNVACIAETVSLQPPNSTQWMGWTLNIHELVLNKGVMVPHCWWADP